VSKRKPATALVWALVSVVILMAMGCGSGPQATATPQPTATRPPPTPSPPPTPTPALSVARVEPDVTDLEAQDIYVRNCDGVEELHDTLAARVAVEVHTTVMEEASASGGSETIEVPPDLRAHLETLVAQAYQDAYMQAIRELMQTELAVWPTMETTVRLRKTQQRYTGTVTFPMDGKTYTAAYEHVLLVPYVTSLSSDACKA
jgi:hypothetical protein